MQRPAPHGAAAPPGQEHWHGADPDGFMEHLAMWGVGEADDGSETTGAEHVTDAQHESAEGDA